MRRALLFTLLASALLSCAEDPITPPPTPFVVDSPEKVIEGLERAHRTRDYDLFAKLLANDKARNAEFLFLLSEQTEEGDDQWGYATETRVHRRMFRPQETREGELPVPADVWLETVDITLTQVTTFNERPELYSEDGGADGKLDPNAWRAISGSYSTNVFFSMVGETDYQVTGQAGFVIIEDLAKSDGEAGRFLLFIWEDIRLSAKAGDESVLRETTWGQIKSLYRWPPREPSEHP